MTGYDRRRPRLPAILAAGLLAFGLASGPAGTASAGPSGSADLQWTQQALKERGFDPGRVNGEMTARTKAALEAYQRSAGLPVTGEPDRATLEKLMAGRPAGATMGNLAAPQHGGGQAPAQPRATSGGHEAQPVPHAAPSARVETGGGTGDLPVYGSETGSGGPVPRAAPSGTVTSGPAPSLPGVSGSAASETTPGVPLQIEAPSWVRAMVIGVILAIFVGFTALWWWSGRRPLRHHPAPDGGGGEERIEPSFGPPDRGRGRNELRAERLR